MRGLRFQNVVDVVALPTGLLVVDLHVERQREFARREDRIEMIGQDAKNMFAGLLASREIAPLAKPQHHVEKAELRIAVGDGVVFAAHRTHADAAEREDSGFHRDLADDFDDLAHIDAGIEIGGIFKREMRHLLLSRESDRPRSKFCGDVAATKARSLSHPTRVYPSWASKSVEVGYIRLRWERAGVRGYGLSLGQFPSPGASRRPLPMGEVKPNS